MFDLHQAVEEELSAYRPVRTPAFEAIRARKRARDQRRVVGAVALSAIVVAGIVLGANTLPGTPDRGSPRAAAAAPSPRSTPEATAKCTAAGPPCNDPTTARVTSCVGTITITASTGEKTTVRPNKPTRVQLDIGQRLQIAGDGSCAQALSATPQSGNALQPERTTTLEYAAVSPGEVQLTVMVPTCTFVPATARNACLGGITVLAQVAVLVRAASSPTDALCQAGTAAYGGTLVASFPTTVGVLRNYLGSSADNLLASWQSTVGTEPAAVCYLDTPVSVSVPPGAPVPNRAQVFAVAGAPVVLGAAGQAASMPAVPIFAGDSRPPH